MSARIWLSAAFALVMLWLWYPHVMEPKQKDTQSSEVEVKPDYIAEKLKQRVFNKQGKLSHQVSADRMEMYQELEFTHFEKPVFTIYSEQGTWQLSAAEATLYSSEQLILEQDVVAKNLTKNAMITQINAKKITYTLSDKKMVSDTEVTMTGPKLTIIGQGLQADLQSEVLDLINHTKTTYYGQ